MIRNATYRIGKSSVTVKVQFPDVLSEWKNSPERLAELLAGQVCHHFVQARVKRVYEKEASKRTDAEKALLVQVEAGEVLDGESFIPKKRSVQRKDNPTTTFLREKWGEFEVEKLEAWCVKWKVEGEDREAVLEEQNEETLDIMITAYWAWKDEEVKKQLAAELD